MEEPKQTFIPPREWIKQKGLDNYFNKTLFRIAFLVLIIFLLVIFYLSGFDFKQHPVVSCTEKDNCINPFFECKFQNITNDTLMFGNLKIINCDDFNKYNCEYDICSKQYLLPGERLGKQEIISQSKMFTICFAFLLFIFIINHLYWSKTKNGKTI